MVRAVAATGRCRGTQETVDGDAGALADQVEQRRLDGGGDGGRDVTAGRLARPQGIQGAFRIGETAQVHRR